MMSEVTKSRKPERKFYRHPRYDDPHSGSEKSASTLNISSDKPGALYTDSIGSVYTSYDRNYHSNRSRAGYSNTFTRGFTRSIQKPYRSARSKVALDGSSSYKCGVAEKPSENTTITKDQCHQPSPVVKSSFSEKQPSDSSQDVLNKPTGDTNSVGRHGGLIHLPKDVHPFDIPDEPKAGPLKQNKRSIRLSTNKPIVVVRPSFSHVSRNSEPEASTSTQSVGKHNAPKAARDGTFHSPSLIESMNVSDSSPHLWSEATEAALHYFLQGLSQLDHENKIGVPTDSCTRLQMGPAPSGSHLPSSISLPPTIRAPNERIMTTIQQIVQLDGTLNSLLVPPGLCASVLSQLPLPPSNENHLTDTQSIIVRWWTAVQQLRKHLFGLFESVIMSDLDFCNTAHVEQGMWKSVFYTVLELLRSWISNPKSTGLLSLKQSKQIETTNEDCAQVTALLQRICISDVIVEGEARLYNLLERIQTIHRVQLAPVLADGRPPPETRSRTRRLVYLSSQKLMLFLGDLARYKELLTGDRNFGKARSWYQKAQLLIPKNGRSYNQLAVLAVYTSRHLDATYYYMRTLAASNPFPTASQSLSALFNEIHPRADSLIQQLRKPKGEAFNSQTARFGTSIGRFLRAEIWIHPIDGRTTVIQGSQRLVYLPAPHYSSATGQKNANKTATRASIESDTVADNEDDDEDAQAEQEEYANMSLIDLSKQFGLTFIHAHGKLFTKIGMETFPDVASLALQALSGLLAQNPCPLSSELLCQLCIINMFNVDRAVSLTAHAAAMPSKNTLSAPTATDSDRYHRKLQPIGRLGGVETLRSVHHDHAARFALDTFSLVCRRTAQLLQQSPPPDASPSWLPPDTRLLLPALRLWSEWMILHPEHWLPPPNHRDPTLRPCLNDWQLVAELCTRAANWLARNPIRPQYEEITPTTSLVIRRKEENADGPLDEDDKSTDLLEFDTTFDAAFLFEESFCAGFKPMLDLVPKMYRFSGQWSPETVADFVRIDKLVLFGDFLCGIDSPVLTYDVDRAVYESAVERESSERKQDQQSENTIDESLLRGRSSSDSDTAIAQTKLPLGGSFVTPNAPESEASADIVALQRQRASLQKQLEEEHRLAMWRCNAVRQAASGGRRAIELEVRPIYLLPDTNCYIDWLEGIATLTQRSSNYTVLVPIVVVNELDTLARCGSKTTSSGRTEQIYEIEANDVTRAGLIQERARAAISFLEHEFAHRNSRLRALTARGSFLETIAYRTEINGGRDPGQVNDDVILACCTHFCKEDPDRFRSNRGLDQSLTTDSNNQPMRIHREIILLTSDRNLRLKAVNINLPARPLRTFVSWSRLPLVTHLPTSVLEPGLSKDGRKSDFPKLQPRGQWRQPLRH